MGYDEFIHSVIKAFNWQKFCSHPPATLVPLVREFYANFTEVDQQFVFVHDVQIPIDRDTVN